MQFREASKLASRQCTGPIKGNISKGEICTWEDTKVKFTFVPDHAYTTEGRLFKTDLATGKKKEI
jgi:hypothetical protein